MTSIDDRNVMNLLDYIAVQNPNGVRKLAYKYGFPAAFNGHNEMVGFMVSFIQLYGEAGYDELLVIAHPDMQDFMELTSANVQKQRNTLAPIQPAYNNIELTNQESQYSRFVGGIVGAIGNVVGGGLDLGTAAINAKSAKGQNDVDMLSAVMGAKVEQEKTKRNIIIAVALVVVAALIAAVFMLRK